MGFVVYYTYIRTYVKKFKLRLYFSSTAYWFIASIIYSIQKYFTNNNIHFSQMSVSRSGCNNHNKVLLRKNYKTNKKIFIFKSYFYVFSFYLVRFVELKFLLLFFVFNKVLIYHIPKIEYLEILKSAIFLVSCI